MADRADVQSLFLQVDASVELLRRNLASGEQPMGQFEQRAAKMAMSVEKSIGTMGKSFGPFAEMAQSAAQKAEKSFEDSFNQIQRMAAKAIEAPTVQGGGLNLGAAEARQAAEAARQQAQAIALIEKAARSAAAGQGVMTQETRLYLQAAAAARIESERHAAQLLREAGALEILEIETRAAASGQQLLVTGHRSVVAASGQQRQATMMLGQQAQDFAVQVVSGQSVLVAFSQQIGQAAFAVQGMGGKMGTVAAFLGSGWGSAVLVATTVLVPLVGKIMEKNDALEDSVKKLKNEARETALNDKAHAIFSKTIEGQIQLQRQLNDELDRSVRTQRQDQQLTLARNEATLASNERSRPGLAARVASQQARVDDYSAQLSRTSTRSSAETQGLAAALSAAEAELKTLKTSLSSLDAAITNGRRNVREAKIPLIDADVSSALDPRAAASTRYDEAIGTLRRRRAIGEGNTGRMFLDEKTGRQYGRQLTGISEVEYRRQAARASIERDAAYKAEQEKQAAERGRRSPQQVFADFRAELAKRGIRQAAGRTGYRSAQDQNEIFRSGDTPLDGYKRPSPHQAWRALDPTRASHNDNAAYAAAQAAGLKGFRIVSESRGRKHYEWKGAGKSGEVDVAGAEGLERRMEAAQNAILADTISYAEQSRQARRRLIDAQGRSAASEEERDRLAREEVEADYDAQKTKIAAQLARKDLKPEEAAELNGLNDRTRDQRMQNITTQRAIERIGAGYDAAAQTADQQMAMLRIQGDMATTLAERRRIALELLGLEQEQYQRGLERTRDTSDDPEAVQRAQDALRSLPERQAAERAQADERLAGPMQQYRAGLQSAVDDTDVAMESIEVRAFRNMEDGFAGIITGTVSVGGAFKRMSNEIIADLARVAAQKVLLSILPGGAGGLLAGIGLSGGGKVEGRAGGGKVTGPGTGTSDSILAMLGPKPIMLSNGESIVTAAATAKFWPVIDAMNKGKIQQLARGGMVSGLPSLRAPRLPAMLGGGSRPQRSGEVIVVHVDKSELFDVHVQRTTAPMAQASVIGGATMAIDEMNERSAQALI